uniref:Uncharacterized protein n=1 Tax=Cacopsylla melanoneura TaxID=428564 RepID=A0A8D8LWS9_9HEMI
MGSLTYHSIEINQKFLQFINIIQQQICSPKFPVHSVKCCLNTNPTISYIGTRGTPSPGSHLLPSGACPPPQRSRCLSPLFSTTSWSSVSPLTSALWWTSGPTKRLTRQVAFPRV